MRLAVQIVAVLIALVLLVIAIGYALPVQHVASRHATFRQPPEAIFAVLTDPSHFADWRSDVTSVEVLATAPLRWREHGSNGDITFVVEESVRRDAWSRASTTARCRLAARGPTSSPPAAEAPPLTITEHGEVYNPLFRFLSRFVFGQTATMDAYLAALQKRLK